MENCKPAHRKCNSAAGNRIVTVSDDVHDGLEWFARFSGEMIASFHPAPARKSPSKHAIKKGRAALLPKVIGYV